MLHILDIKNFDLKKIPPKFYDALFILFFKLGIDGNEFIDDFIRGYIAYVFNKTGKKNDIYAATGFSRRYIYNYVNDIISQNKSINNTNIANHKSLIKRLMEIAENFPDGIIPIRGAHNSFHAAFSSIETFSKDITARAMMDKLIRVGVLEAVDKNHIRFVTSLLSTGLNDPDDIIRHLANNLNRLCHTLAYNMDVENNDDSLTQLTIWSDRISLEKQGLCIDDLREETRNYLKNCERILLSYEEKGLAKKEAEALGIELGVSAFIFNNHK